HRASANPAASRIVVGSAPIVVKQFGQKGLEIIGLGEVPVHRGKAHEGDVIELLKSVHDEGADLFGGDLALPQAFELAHDARDHAFGRLVVDIALAQGGHHRARELLPVEGYLATGFLDHDEVAQLDALEGREAAAAAVADTAAADRVGIFGGTAVLDLCVVLAAIGAAHRVAGTS